MQWCSAGTMFVVQNAAQLSWFRLWGLLRLEQRHTFTFNFCSPV